MVVFKVESALTMFQLQNQQRFINGAAKFGIRGHSSKLSKETTFKKETIQIFERKVEIELS